MKRVFLISLALILSSYSQGQQSSPPRPAITGISHVILFAHNLSNSQKFYKSLLGWEQVPATEAKSGTRFYANHTQYIELLATPEPHRADRVDTVAFTTSDVEALRVYLAARGVSVPNSVTAEANGDRSLVIRDPEGHKVGFTQSGTHSPSKPADAPQRLSPHIMHAGYVVRNRAAMDHFYKDILGFHLYWQGGSPESRVDWVMMQVPDGTDWMEYMLYLPAQPSMEELGSANHFSPGVASVAELQKMLEQRGWKAAEGKNPQILGVDGKLQLDLLDPDGTRVEFMEASPVKKPCCSAYTGSQPKLSAAW